MSVFNKIFVLSCLLVFSSNYLTLAQDSTLGNNSAILTLKDAIETALENNHHVKSAVATLPITEAKLIIAKYRPNPQAGSSSEIVRGGALNPVHLGTEIELGRKRHWRIKLAKEQISKTELEIRKALWEIHTLVHATYAELSVGFELLKFAKERTKFYKSLLDIVQKKFEAGDISKLELTRAQMEYLSSENKLSEFEGTLKKARVEFNHILGKEPDFELVLDTPEKLKPKIKLHEHPVLRKVIDQALEKRLELAILEKEFGITRAELKKAKWGFLPNLYIEGGVVKPSLGTNIWGPYIGGSLELPVFNRKQGEIKEAKAKLNYLEKESERIKHDIKIEVANAFNELEVREEQIHRFQERLLESSEDILLMIKKGYESGKLSLTDALNSEQQNRETNEMYLSAILNYQLAVANLEYAGGVPLYEFGERL